MPKVAKTTPPSPVLPDPSYCSSQKFQMGEMVTVNGFTGVYKVVEENYHEQSGTSSYFIQGDGPLNNQAIRPECLVRQGGEHPAVTKVAGKKSEKHVPSATIQQPPQGGKTLAQTLQESRKAVGKPPQLPSPPVPPVPDVIETKRSVKFLWRADSGHFGVLRIENGTTQDYFFRWLSGEVFQLTKLDAFSEMMYTVRIGHVISCGCKAFEVGKGAECKHIASLKSLRVQKKL